MKIWNNISHYFRYSGFKDNKTKKQDPSMYVFEKKRLEVEKSFRKGDKSSENLKGRVKKGTFGIKMKSLFLRLPIIKQIVSFLKRTFSKKPSEPFVVSEPIINEKPSNMITLNVKQQITLNGAIDEFITREEAVQKKIEIFQLTLEKLHAQKQLSNKEFEEFYNGLVEIRQSSSKILDSIKTIENDPVKKLRILIEGLTEDKLTEEMSALGSYAEKMSDKKNQKIIKKFIKSKNKRKKWQKALSFVLEKNPDSGLPDSLSFDSFTTFPMQRIGRIPLLLTEISKALPDDSDEKQKIDSLRERAKDLVVEINSKFPKTW